MSAQGPPATTKPGWDAAPDWANWLAMDASGEWYWYENEPSPYMQEWGAPGVFHVAFLTNWVKSLESRPKTNA